MESPVFIIPHSRVNHWSYTLLFWTCSIASVSMLALLAYALAVNTPHKAVMIIFLLFVSAVFGGVAWYINSFGKNYVAGVQVFNDCIGIFYPKKKKNERLIKISFQDIEKIKFISFFETYYYKNIEKKTLILKIEILYNDKQLNELKLLEVENTIKNKTKFEQLPEFLIKGNYLPTSKIEIKKC